MKPDYIFHFLKRFEIFFVKNKLINKNDKLVVAVSGGLDSIVLLYCLEKIKFKMNLQLIVAHLNHKLRDVESDQDEQFVANLATQYDIKFASDCEDIKAFASSNKLSIETAARELRYRFLEETKDKYQFDKIITGHHADDQAETVFQNLLRGAGWSGLSGIPIKRESIIRPLLFASRQELEKLAEAAKLEWRTDASNDSLDFRRNQIRHQVFPVLQKQFSPQITKRLIQFSEVFKEGDEYLKGQAQIAFNQCLKFASTDKIILEIERFCSYFTILRKYVLFHLFATVGLPQNVFSFPQILEVLELIDKRKLGRSIPISGDWSIGVDRSGIIFYRESNIKPVHVSLKIGDCIAINERKLKITSGFIEPNCVEFSSNNFEEFCDAGKLTDSFCEIRSIKNGDSFFPLGINNHQKLSDFFINQKISVWDRKPALVLTNDENIVWLIGYRLDDRYKITKQTKKVVKLKIVRE